MEIDVEQWLDLVILKYTFFLTEIIDHTLVDEVVFDKFMNSLVEWTMLQVMIFELVWVKICIFLLFDITSLPYDAAGGLLPHLLVDLSS
jgi:hypothetical protein